MISKVRGSTCLRGSGDMMGEKHSVRTTVRTQHPTSVGQIRHILLPLQAFLVLRNYILEMRYHFSTRSIKYTCTCTSFLTALPEASSVRHNGCFMKTRRQGKRNRCVRLVMICGGKTRNGKGQISTEKRLQRHTCRKAIAWVPGY